MAAAMVAAQTAAATLLVGPTWTFRLLAGDTQAIMLSPDVKAKTTFRVAADGTIAFTSPMSTGAGTLTCSVAPDAKNSASGSGEAKQGKWAEKPSSDKGAQYAEALIQNFRGKFTWKVEPDGEKWSAAEDLLVLTITFGFNVWTFKSRDKHPLTAAAAAPAAAATK